MKVIGKIFYKDPNYAYYCYNLPFSTLEGVIKYIAECLKVKYKVIKIEIYEYEREGKNIKCLVKQ